MFRYLQAFSCEEYLYHVNASDTEVSTMGLQAIDAAIQQWNNDEYIVLKQVLHSYNLRPDAPDILLIQKNYDKSCPDIQKLQDTLIDKEYLQEIYKQSRGVSLERTITALEERGLYQQSIDTMKLLLDLNTPLGYIFGSSFLYYAHFKREEYKSFWNEEKAFLYAKQGADYGIQYMKSNYDPENVLSQVWMSLVKQTALRYLYGVGVEHNLSEAKYYYSIGVSYDDEECRNQLKEMEDWKLVVIDVFKNRCISALSSEADGIELVVYPVKFLAHHEKKRSTIKELFRIESDETILFVHDTSLWKSCKQGLVITCHGITCIPNNKEFLKFYWLEVAKVKYQDGRIYFFDTDGNIGAYIGMNLFVRNVQRSDINELGNALASAFEEMAQCYKSV